MVECCKTPDVTFPICTPTLAVSGVKLYLFLGFGSLSPCVVFVVMHLISCHHVHCICIRVRLMHPSIFPVVRFAFRRSVLLRWSFLAFLSCVGIKHFRIGPRLAKRPWFTTGRPPVKFRIIWTSFDTPTVNRGTEKASCVLQPNTPPIWPKTHQTLLHVLERSITIAWPKTAPHLDSPSSLHLYIKTPPRKSRISSL